MSCFNFKVLYCSDVLFIDKFTQTNELVIRAFVLNELTFVFGGNLESFMTGNEDNVITKSSNVNCYLNWAMNTVISMYALQLVLKGQQMCWDFFMDINMHNVLVSTILVIILQRCIRSIILIQSLHIRSKQVFHNFPTIPGK